MLAHRSHLTGAVAGLAAAALSGCAGEVPIVQVEGECAEVHQAQLCTWARMQGETVLAVGATVPAAFVENAEDHDHLAWPPVGSATLRMPEASLAQAGLTEVTVFWEPMGHPPGPYLTPHFDFHFYTIPRDQRTGIDCSDLSKPAVMPAGYALPDVVLPPVLAELAGQDTLIGLCVQEMGMHSLLTTELESTDTFQGSMVIGFYQGAPIFIEPMVTRALLMEKRSFDLPFPAIPGMPEPYPKAFRAEFDAELGVYQFVFTDFAPAEGAGAGA
jgi:hypothetical protein